MKILKNETYRRLLFSLENTKDLVDVLIASGRREKRALLLKISELEQYSAAYKSERKDMHRKIDELERYSSAKEMQCEIAETEIHKLAYANTQLIEMYDKEHPAETRAVRKQAK